MTNSSVVVPFASSQIEDGLIWIVHDIVKTLDGSETRTRIGAFHCAEILVDLPNYIRSLTPHPRLHSLMS